MILAISGRYLPLHFEQRRPNLLPKVLNLLDPNPCDSGETVEDELESPPDPNLGAPALESIPRLVYVTLRLRLA